MRAVVKTSRTSYLKLIRGEAIKQESTRRHWTSVFTEAIREDPSGNSRTINKTWWAKPRMFIVLQAALMLNLSCSDHGSRSGFLTSFVSLITLTRRQELDQSWGTPLLSRPDLHPYLAFFFWLSLSCSVSVCRLFVYMAVWFHLSDALKRCDSYQYHPVRRKACKTSWKCQRLSWDMYL